MLTLSRTESASPDTPTLATPVWDDAPWDGFPSLDAPTTADVCVVGLGGSGLACIAELVAAGRDVVGVDAGVVAGGAAGRNGGFLLAGAASFYHRAVRAMGRERAREFYAGTCDEIARMAAETPEAVRLTGSLRIAADDAELEDCEAQYAVMREDGLRVERYDGPEGRGLLLPTDGVFNPMARGHSLARRAASAGARLFERTRAAGVAPGVVRTAHGDVRCTRVIVAVDGGLGALVPALAPRVRDVRLQMLATAPAPEVSLPRPVYTRYGYDYYQQLPDGRVALGGCRDVGGAAEETSVALPSAAVQDALTRCLRERVGVTAEVTHRWAAVVSYTHDGVPICEEVAPGVWVLGAYSGTGNVVGAMLGRRVARSGCTA